jgi:ATP-dependent Clp protease ATP-binding subunit ClpB
LDIHRYNFSCQKAFHQGLQLAQSYGHQFLEVEHVALALIRGQALLLGAKLDVQLKQDLEKSLVKMQRIFGNVKPKFGSRLDSALDHAEAKASESPVDENVLWESLIRESTALKTSLAKIAEVDSSGKANAHASNPEEFKELFPKGASNDKKADAEKIFKIDKKLQKYLDDFTTDLTALAERKELDPVIGRDGEVRRVLEILGRKKKNNPILLGEPGVGKTAIAEGIAQKIAVGQVPELMKEMRVLSLDLGAMLAGAKYRGEFEERLKGLMNAVEACQGRIILFIDEIHMLVGAGGSEGTVDAANFLKPALARGTLRCLGATTLDEYRKYIEADPALERRFQPVNVEEPTADVAIAVMRGLKASYEVHHGVQIDDEALVAAVNLSIKFLPSRNLPDKAIDLLDEACSRLRYQIDSVPAVMDQLRGQIEGFEIERQAIGSEDVAKAKTARIKLDVKLEKVRQEYNEIEKIWSGHKELLENLRQSESARQETLGLFESAKGQANFDFAAKLQYGELPKIEEKLALGKKSLDASQAMHPWLCQRVGAPQIAEIIAGWTKIPTEKILEKEASRLNLMEQRIQDRVFGQQAAVNLVCRAIKRARLGINDPARPLGVFLFCGPTGVGKTETAKALAAELFDDQEKMVRIDMSEYMEQHNVSRLIGSPPGYVGFGEGGQLSEPIRQNPYSVVLFDEIEKAHSGVLDLLLQIFEDGRLTDGKGRLINFRHSLIIMTSNLAVPVFRFENPLEADEEVRGILAQRLRPEFINRIDEIVVFKRLGRPHLDQLLRRLTWELNMRIADRQIRIALGPNLRTSLMSVGLEGQFGGRAVRRAFQTVVVDAVSSRLLDFTNMQSGSWVLELEPAGGVSWDRESDANRLLPAARS